MLKIKFLMAALIAISFCGSDSFAAKAGKKEKAFAKWTETGQALKDKCSAKCTKITCKKSEIAAECSKNCRKEAAFELVDCTPGAYAAKCGTYAKDNAGSDASGVKGAKINSRKEDGTCLLLAKANAAIMNKIYEARDNKASSLGGGKMSAEETADEANYSREAKMWKMLKSLDAANDVSSEAAPAE